MNNPDNPHAAAYDSDEERKFGGTRKTNMLALDKWSTDQLLVLKAHGHVSLARSSTRPSRAQRRKYRFCAASTSSCSSRACCRHQLSCRRVVLGLAAVMPLVFAVELW